MANDTNIYKVKNGGGWFILLGFPFMVISFFIFASVLGVDPEKGKVPLMIVLMGTAFFLIGSVFVFGRSGIAVNVDSNSISQWWGLLFPFSKTTVSLDKFDKILLSQERRSKNKTKVAIFFVKLSGKDGTDDIEVRVTENYNLARKTGEDLSQLLDMEFKDSSMPSPAE
jgi:hypothetical protein